MFGNIFVEIYMYAHIWIIVRCDLISVKRLSIFNLSLLTIFSSFFFACVFCVCVRLDCTFPQRTRTSSFFPLRLHSPARISLVSPWNLWACVLSRDERERERERTFSPETRKTMRLRRIRSSRDLDIASRVTRAEFLERRRALNVYFFIDTFIRDRAIHRKNCKSTNKSL